MLSTHNVHMYPKHTGVFWTYKPWCQIGRHNILTIYTMARGGGQLVWLILTTQIYQAIGEYQNQYFI